jgi:hypothetical protein
MVYDHNLQGAHCRESPSFTGRWHSSKRDGTWWRVWSCRDHVDELTAVREFGGRGRHRIFNQRPERVHRDVDFSP